MRTVINNFKHNSGHNKKEYISYHSLPNELLACLPAILAVFFSPYLCIQYFCVVLFSIPQLLTDLFMNQYEKNLLITQSGEKHSSLFHLFSCTDSETEETHFTVRHWGTIAAHDWFLATLLEEWVWTGAWWSLTWFPQWAADQTIFYCRDKKGPGQVLQEPWPSYSRAASTLTLLLMWTSIVTHTVSTEVYSRHCLFFKMSWAAFIDPFMWVWSGRRIFRRMFDSFVESRGVCLYNTMQTG